MRLDNVSVFESLHFLLMKFPVAFQKKKNIKKKRFNPFNVFFCQTSLNLNFHLPCPFPFGRQPGGLQPRSCGSQAVIGFKGTVQSSLILHPDQAGQVGFENPHVVKKETSLMKGVEMELIESFP